MATHPSILAWNIPRTKEPGMLQSMGSKRVGHSWVAEHTRVQLYIYNSSIFIPTFLEFKQTVLWIVSALFPTKLILNRGQDCGTLLGALLFPALSPSPYVSPAPFLEPGCVLLRVVSGRSPLLVRSLSWPRSMSYSILCSHGTDSQGTCSWKMISVCWEVKASKEGWKERIFQVGRLSVKHAHCNFQN